MERIFVCGFFVGGGAGCVAIIVLNQMVDRCNRFLSGIRYCLSALFPYTKQKSCDIRAPSAQARDLLGDRLAVGQQILTLFTVVRIHVPQPLVIMLAF